MDMMSGIGLIIALVPFMLGVAIAIIVIWVLLLAGKALKIYIDQHS